MPPQEAMTDTGGCAIRPPTTTGDNAKPSSSLVLDVRRVAALMEDERLLAAHDLYTSVQERLQEWKDRRRQQQSPTKSSSPKLLPKALRRPSKRRASVHTEDHEYHAANDLLDSKKEDLVKLEKQAAVIARAKQTVDVDDDWILSQTLFGVTTYYRREPDNSLSIKLEGELSGMPLFEQIAVLKEVDLHYKWAPFCTSSMTLKDLDKLDTVGWVMVGLPQFGLARDGCFRAFGCDCMMEDGSFVLVGQGVQDRDDGVVYDEEYLLEGMEGVPIPDPPSRLGSGRATIRSFSAVVHVISPTCVRTRLVSNINPNLAFIPQSLIDFVMRKMCGHLLSRLQHAAKKAATDPVDNVHAIRMRQEKAFYQGWLLPKFRSYCDHVDWEMPLIPAFSLSAEQLAQQHASTTRSAPPVRSLTTADTADSTSSAMAMDDEMHHAASAPNLHEMAPAASSTSTTLDLPVHSSSSISSVSGVSSKSVFTNNPITQFLRDMEERTQREKARKIEEGRQRAADRLKPKDLSDSKRSRLLELKEAKDRRLRAARPTAERAPVETKVEAVGFADRFHFHDRRTRFVVTSFLVVCLLVSLNADALFGIETMLRIHGDSIWTNVLLDIATFAYLGISGALHCFMSYVSLVYAYDALDLGTKSGTRSKEYFGSTIRFFVVAMSGSIVTLSIVNAIVRVWFRWILWHSLQAAFWLKDKWRVALSDPYDASWVLDSVPESVQSMSATIWSIVSGYVRDAVSIVTGIAAFLQHWFMTLFVRSNFIGRSVLSIFVKLVGFLMYIPMTWDSYTTSIIEMYGDDDVSLASWRGMAIDTARPLFTYSAVFLLSLLLLFNFSARVEGKRAGYPEGETTASTVATDDFPMISDIASAPVGVVPPTARRYRPQPISSVSIQDDIIPEDEDMSMSVAQSVPAAGMNEIKRKKRFRLRLRKKKKKGIDSSDRSESDASSYKMKRMQTY